MASTTLLLVALGFGACFDNRLRLWWTTRSWHIVALLALAALLHVCAHEKSAGSLNMLWEDLVLVRLVWHEWTSPNRRRTLTWTQSFQYGSQTPSQRRFESSPGAAAVSGTAKAAARAGRKRVIGRRIFILTIVLYRRCRFGGL
ncbi:uncharacterized protein BDR25DRAFT_369545 [Lindgomyces ingoldianus]|uniref:Uncharacterized protein n=1 Tax=Lindgomyces ingoldianus TaxID=673940 RepID=A0ACB6QWC3_9PLEO|nr:uncharacterized protein BDR25DRAFT_369545 [Lindgomyces ingoldianus]KAF2470375.1 hypothetical protein BDR25DRAFT_369545 [Lindgomyces ingoldianus]